LPRTLSADVENEKNKEYNRPVELYQIFLDESILYLANYDQDIEFFDEDGNAQTYEAAALSRDDIKISSDLQSNKMTVRIDNVARDMSAYLAYNDFRGKKLRLLKVFLDELNSYDDATLLFEGEMDEPAVDEYELSLTVTQNIDINDKSIPSRTFSLRCDFEFGSEECGVTKPTISGVVDSVENYKKLYLSEVNGDEANRWAYGHIEVDDEYREIVSSGDGFVNIDMPFSEDPTGKSYNLEAGCDKTYSVEDGSNTEVNHGCSYWNNTSRFGGFLSIPEAQEVGR